jgi:hypothetical protein
MPAEARSRIVRYLPDEAAAADDVLRVDIRPADERARAGVIRGSRCMLVRGFEAWLTVEP